MYELNTLWPPLVISAVTTVILVKCILQSQTTSKQALIMRGDISKMLDSVKNRQLKREIFREKQKLTETVVDKGSNTVESVHKVISGLTFDILENIPTTKHTSKVVRKVHDKTSSSVYDTVRSVNRQIGEISNELLKSTSKSDTKETKDGKKTNK